MKVYVYQGSIGVVEKSGVGQAIFHQVQSMKDAMIPVVEKDDPQVTMVHLNTVFPDSVLEARRARRQGKKIIWYGHSTEEDFRDSFKFSNLLSPLFRRWIVWCYSQADAVITPTEYSRDIIRGYGVTKPVYVLSNGVDTDFFKADAEAGRRFREKYDIPQDKKVVISVGHYMERKGILDFIDLAEKMPDVDFYWFGYTQPVLVTENVREVMKNAGPNVFFPGYVQRDDLRDAYCGSDLFCFMSHEETEGIVVLEALACGVPVLVRDIPVYSSWLHNGVNAYKASDQDEFLKRAWGILEKKVPALVEEGRYCAETRSLQAVGEKLRMIHEAVESAQN